MIRKELGSERRQFSNLFVATVLILMTLPLFITSQDLITKILNVSGLGLFIQNFIVPVEVKFVIAMLRIVGIDATGDLRLIVLNGAEGEVFRAQIIWSCIGWQSVLLLFVTIITGFRGSYTLPSKFEAVIIGLLGTFWINIIRIVAIYFIGFHFGQLQAVLFHNFAGTIMTILWLFLFWWFSYAYVLEETKE